MRAYDIIYKKRNGDKLNKDEISFLINGIIKKTIPDYQLSAFLMAAFLSGLDSDETSILTECMMNSGRVMDLNGIDRFSVDKHSTGGVGDKISLIIAPAVAACGATVPMMSGRGLGHTGGTLDKLESIPGFNTQLSESKFKDMLSSIGVSMIGQTDKLAPADKKLYALRDVTATVDSIPLITASIMSKKLAEGSSAIVMDVKWGNGAFMKNIEDARELAQSLVSVGKEMNRKMAAFITDMNEPLGTMVGNTLEVREAIDCLKGEGPDDVMEISAALSAQMLYFADKADSYESGLELFNEAIDSGRALEKFTNIVRLQGGDESYIKNPEKFKKADDIVEVPAQDSGFIEKMDTSSIGIASILLGAGRESTEDIIDHSAGIEVIKKIGDKIEKGEPIARLHICKKSKTSEAAGLYLSSISISQKETKKLPLIAGKII
ncbi:MAG: thymidine phosphorylase [Spirochaetes bacterium]|nr:thymidine phosphorylase [Spirochaetota bacterium]